MDLVALKAEIENHPRGLGYAGKTYSQVKTILNSNHETVSRPIGPQVLWEYLFENSRWVAIVVAQTDASLSVEKRNAAIAIVEAAGGSIVDEETRTQLMQQIVLTSAPFANAVALMQEAGVLSPDQGAAILALGDVSLPRDEALGLGHVRCRDLYPIW